MAHINQFNPQHATFIQHLSGIFPHIRHNETAIFARQTLGSNPLHSCHFSAFSRVSRRHKMSIQRLLGSFPPAISADVLHKMQNVQ